MRWLVDISDSDTSSLFAKDKLIATFKYQTTCAVKYAWVKLACFEPLAK